MYVFSRSNLEMPEVKRSIYPGSSSGDLVGPINVEKFQDRHWQVTEEEKKKYYGAFRIAVGGTTDKDALESGKRQQFKRSELARKPPGLDESVLFEPMAYSGMPPEFFKDMLHVWSPRAVIDFTAMRPHRCHGLLGGQAPLPWSLLFGSTYGCRLPAPQSDGL